jgi:hypothetical protein
MKDTLEEILNRYAWSSQQKNQLRIAYKKGLDIAKLANPKFDWEQLREIIICMEYDVDPSPLLNPSIDSEDMEKIRLHLFQIHGIYDKEKEAILQKRLKRIIWTISAGFIFLGVIFMVYINRDYIALYFDSIELELVSDQIELGLSDKFKPMDYIKRYDDSFNLSIPKADWDSPGQYIVQYTLENAVKKIKRTLIVNVFDDIPPIIILKQESIILMQGEAFNALDYIESVHDNIDGNLIDKVNYTTIDITKLGMHTVTYTVSDTQGNQAIATLDVYIQKEENIPIAPGENQSQVNEPAENNTGGNDTNSNPPPSIDIPIVVTAQNKQFINREDPLSQQELAIAYGDEALRLKRANGYRYEPLHENNQPIGYIVIFF